MPAKTYFSKSKLISGWQCQKLLYLDRHHRNLAEVSDDLQAVFDVGHRVGRMAQELYGTDESVEIPYNRKSRVMLKETQDLLATGVDFPIFEATFEYKGVLIRADVMTPEDDGWHVIEVKSGTSAKDVNKIDAAIQLWVLRGAGLNIKSISLAYIDNQFVYQGDGDYTGLLKKEDVTEIAESLQAEVAGLVKRCGKTVQGKMPEVGVGVHCEEPYDCAFRSVCWPTGNKYPITGIGGTKKDIFGWVNRGLGDIRDIPADEIKGAKREWIYRVTQSGEPDVLEGAKEVLDALPYPRYHLDFETTGPAIPIWKGTRPYRHVPFQWSVHIDDGQGDGSLDYVEHKEFLNLDGEPPMRELAESLIECLGNSGPVFEYTNVEEQVIRQLAGMFPDLEKPLLAIVERLFDLAKVTSKYYYHPSMLGSWSLKYVGPAIAPHIIDYKELDEIADGMAAANFYQEAIHPDTTPERKADLEKKLLKYCWVDTAAMVEIVRALSGQEDRNQMRDELLANRNAYNYPAVGLSSIDGQLQHRDFDSYYAMDTYHTDLLHSAASADKVLGYLSVVYWGFFSGLDGRERPERAMGRVDRATAANIGAGTVAGVIDNAIGEQGGRHYGAAVMSLTELPQLGFAFAAKVSAFLNPNECGVADSVIAGNRPEFNFAMTNNIVRTSRANAASYDEFCSYLQRQRDYMNAQGPDYRWTDIDGQRRAWRAIDIERALFAA